MCKDKPVVILGCFKVFCLIVEYVINLSLRHFVVIWWRNNGVFFLLTTQNKQTYEINIFWKQNWEKRTRNEDILCLFITKNVYLRLQLLTTRKEKEELTAHDCWILGAFGQRHKCITGGGRVKNIFSPQQCP